MESVAKLLEKRLVARVAQASRDFELLEPRDRVLVAVSGGKDSLTLLRVLRLLCERTPFPFSLMAVTVDQGQPGFDRERLASYLEAEGYEYHMVVEDTFSVIRDKVPPGQTYCSLCSRLRRGILYTTATRLGATKIALGHHREDFAETLLLNAFYSGQLKAMPARLCANDGRNTVIRPLLYCSERDIQRYAELSSLPVLPMSLCGREPNLKRQRIKRLLDELSQENPHVRGNLLAALCNVRPSHLLDRRLASPAPTATRRPASPGVSAEPGSSSADGASGPSTREL